MPLAAAIPYIAAAASVAGAGLGIAGNEESQEAMNEARAKEVAQQKALQDQSNAIFQKSLKQSTPDVAAQEMNQGAGARTNAWSSLNTATTPVASALPATATGISTPTSQAAKRAGSAADSWNSLNATAAAKEGSYGDWENKQAIKNADAAQKLGVVNNFSQGDAALFPTELGVAGQAGSQLSGWGSIVSSLGSLAGMANSSGLFKTPVDANGVPVANETAALNEFNTGASKAGQGFIQGTLPAVDDSGWLTKIYS